MTSDEHKVLTSRCLPWLRGRITRRGVRAGFEVPLADGYVADWVALAGFQYQFERRFKNKAQREFERRNGCRVSVEFACVFEAKVSRSDFQKMFGHGYGEHGRDEPKGSLHWVVAPRRLVHPSEVPEFWGLLEPRGGGLSELKQPRYCPLPERDLFRLAYHLLWYGKETP